MRVSVVVPTYRRPEQLQRCLEALAAQSLASAEYEIIVADDADDAGTRWQVAQFRRQSQRNISYVPVTGRHGPAAARNAGWHAAAAPLIAFTDDDCVPEPEWLDSGVRIFSEDVMTVAVSGKTIVPLPRSPSDYERDAAGLESAEFVTANCFVRRRALEMVGGFDERFRVAWREDSDLHFALLSLGGNVVRNDAVRVCHPVRPAPWGISLKQQKKCLFDALLFKKYPGLFRQHIRPGPPWDYYVALAALVCAALAYGAGHPELSLLALAIWFVLTIRFFWRRIRHTSHSPRHLAEMAVTSALIPPLSVFWRIYGALKFRVWFV